MTSELFDWAEQNGLTLFPCNAADKTPVGSWTQWQGTKTSRAQWEAWTKKGYVLAILSSEKLGLLDIDDLALAQALFNLNKIAKAGGMVVLTPGGGVHIYFKGDQAIPAKTWKLRRTDASTNPSHKSDEVTLRGASREGKPSGYLIAPGQKNAAGKEYSLWQGCDWNSKPVPVEGGEAFIRAFERRLAAQIGKTIFALNTDVVHDVSALWQGAKAGDRHHSLVILYSALRRAGIEAGERKKLLLEWNKRNQPPKSDREILDVIRDLDSREVYKFSLTEPPREAIKKITKKMEQNDDEIAIVSMKNLLEMEVPKTDWVVDSLIPKVGITILAAKRAMHKTNLSLCLAMCVATGKKFLNAYDTIQGKAFFCDEENGLRLIQSRTEAIANGLEITGDTDLLFTSLQGVNNGKLEKIMQAHKPVLIIVDSWRRITPTDENDAGAVAMFFQELRRITMAAKTSVVLLHHLRKDPTIRQSEPDSMDSIRGSGELANNADSILILSKRSKAAGDTFVLTQAKSRYGAELPPQIIGAEWKDNHLKFVLLGEATEALQADERAATAIMEWLATEGKHAFRTADVKKALKNAHSEPTVERGLKVLLDQAKLVKPKKGYYEVVKVVGGVSE